MSEQELMPAIEALCSLCWVAIHEATQSILGYDTQACPHCQTPYTRYRKLKDDRTSPYGNFMEAMCTPCAVAAASAPTKVTLRRRAPADWVFSA